MANENTDSVLVVTRATYDSRKEQGEILNDVLYIVQEPSTNSNKFLSFYLGLAQCTDIISLDGSIVITGDTDFSTINIPSELAIKNKLYTLIDDTNNIIRVYSCDNHLQTIPLCGLPIWED